MAGDNYVGTAYTFEAKSYTRELWAWGQNSVQYFSSPVQIPGTQWSGQSRHQAAGGSHYYIKLT